MLNTVGVLETRKGRYPLLAVTVDEQIQYDPVSASASQWGTQGYVAWTPRSPQNQKALNKLLDFHPEGELAPGWGFAPSNQHYAPVAGELPSPSRGTKRRSPSRPRTDSIQVLTVPEDPMVRLGDTPPGTPNSLRDNGCLKSAPASLFSPRDRVRSRGGLNPTGAGPGVQSMSSHYVPPPLPPQANVMMAVALANVAKRAEAHKEETKVWLTSGKTDSRRKTRSPKRGPKPRLTPTTVDDWELLLEQNRSRMMKEIDDVTTLLKLPPSLPPHRSSYPFSGGMGPGSGNRPDSASIPFSQPSTRLAINFDSDVLPDITSTLSTPPAPWSSQQQLTSADVLPPSRGSGLRSSSSVSTASAHASRQLHNIKASVSSNARGAWVEGPGSGGSDAGVGGSRHGPRSGGSAGAASLQPLLSRSLQAQSSMQAHGLQLGRESESRGGDHQSGSPRAAAAAAVAAASAPRAAAPGSPTHSSSGGAVQLPRIPGPGSMRVRSPSPVALDDEEDEVHDDHGAATADLVRSSSMSGSSSRPSAPRSAASEGPHAHDAVASGSGRAAPGMGERPSSRLSFARRDEEARRSVQSHQHHEGEGEEDEEQEQEDDEELGPGAAAGPGPLHPAAHAPELDAEKATPASLGPAAAAATAAASHAPVDVRREASFADLVADELPGGVQPEASFQEVLSAGPALERVSGGTAQPRALTAPDGSEPSSQLPTPDLDLDPASQSRPGTSAGERNRSGSRAHSASARPCSSGEARPAWPPVLLDEVSLEAMGAAEGGIPMQQSATEPDVFVVEHADGAGRSDSPGDQRGAHAAENVGEPGSEPSMSGMHGGDEEQEAYAEGEGEGEGAAAAGAQRQRAWEGESGAAADGDDGAAAESEAGEPEVEEAGAAAAEAAAAVQNPVKTSGVDYVVVKSAAVPLMTREDMEELARQAELQELAQSLADSSSTTHAKDAQRAARALQKVSGTTPLGLSGGPDTAVADAAAATAGVSMVRVITSPSRPARTSHDASPLRAAAAAPAQAQRHATPEKVAPSAATARPASPPKQPHIPKPEKAAAGTPPPAPAAPQAAAAQSAHDIKTMQGVTAIGKAHMQDIWTQ